MKKITELSAKEKLNLLCGKDCWHTDDLDGKIPQLFVSDGPVGLRTERTGKNGKPENIPAVAFPSIQVLANTWSEKCAKKMGNALADEAHDRGVDILLAPGVNIKRNPLNGRNFEYFSEDPFSQALSHIFMDTTQRRTIYRNLHSKNKGISEFCFFRSAMVA